MRTPFIYVDIIFITRLNLNNFKRSASPEVLLSAVLNTLALSMVAVFAAKPLSAGCAWDLGPGIL